jgi:hypothetical protein
LLSIVGAVRVLAAVWVGTAIWISTSAISTGLLFSAVRATTVTAVLVVAGHVCRLVVLREASCSGPEDSAGKLEADGRGSAAPDEDVA